jgi:hypothetical protein
MISGPTMTNPWLKKNPFMSMWLSGANAAAGSLRGHAVAQARRQTTRAMTKATNDMFNVWANGLTASPTKKAKKRRR